MAARKRLGWSREALAFHAGLSWSAIVQIESGRRTNVRPTTLTALSDALGVTVDYLLGRDGRAHPMFEHHALIYATADDFGAAAASFLAEGIKRSEATLAVTTKRNVTAVRKRLGDDASKVTFADAKRWYTTPAGTLDAYCRFVHQQLGEGAGWIRILGEPVWSGRSADEVLRWARYESLLNLEFAGLPVTLVCPYDETALDPAIVDQACVTHQHTRTHGGLVSNAGYRPPGHFALD